MKKQQKHVFEIELSTEDLSDILSLLEDREISYRSVKVTTAQADETARVIRPRFGARRSPYKHPSGMRGRDFLFAYLKKASGPTPISQLDEYLVSLGFADHSAHSRSSELQYKYEQPIIMNSQGILTLSAFGRELDRLPDEPQGLRQAVLRRVAAGGER